ncbi:MAG TPA: hypothetical protein VH092_06295 [Urbifossiella sp.]|jgi:hypothetical protein|nr:hypothetical protein [Urbifossiella sp.]
MPRLPGPNIARPAVVGRIRSTEELDGVRISVTGAGCIVRIVDNSDGRRKLNRYADAHGIMLTRLTPENRPHTYGGRNAPGWTTNDNGPTGARADYQALGTGLALRELAGQPFVVHAEDIVNIRVPVGAQGSGPEKARPASGSMFGKPGTLKGTATALAHARSERFTAAVKAGEL